jgi:sirohydrochlorin cobaltochelatase
MLDLAKAALILVGHGSTRNRDSAQPVYFQAAEMRRRQRYREVHASFWKQDPHLVQVLSQVKAVQVFIVPLLTSRGYFADEVIPRELGLPQGELGPAGGVRVQDGRTLYYCAPVGTHESMTRVILHRAKEVVQSCPFPREPGPQETALLIAGHGTTRNENSRRAVEDQATRIRAESVYCEVHSIFLEETPRIQDCYRLSSLRHFVVVPFFISDGLHATEDIPVLLGESEDIVRERVRTGLATWRNPTERNGKLVWYARSVGTDPSLGEVIQARVSEAFRSNLAPLLST